MTSNAASSLLLRENQQRLAHLRERQSAGARIIRGRKIRDYIHIEVQDELIAIAVDAINRRAAAAAAAPRRCTSLAR